jgi:hypothetical protein
MPIIEGSEPATSGWSQATALGQPIMRGEFFVDSRCLAQQHARTQYWVKMNIKHFFAATLFFLAVASVHAADVPAALIDGNANVCVQVNSNPKMKSLDKFAPVDAAKIPSYCSCYAKKYWDSVPQADYDGMMAEHAAGELKGKHGMAIRAQLHTRNETAKKACQ